MIRYSKDTDHIVTLTLDMTNRSANIINHEVCKAFMPVLEHLKAEKQQGNLRGIIITSAKKTFLTGGDLDYLYHASDPAAIFDHSQMLHHFFRELEAPGVPVVAAINGSALGTGYELALACHHRITVNRSDIKLGLTETSLGIMPSGGSVIRLMWLLGIDKAYKILATGAAYTPLEALDAGLTDSLAEDEKDLLEKAHAWLLENREDKRPWDIPGRKIPGGAANTPAMHPVIRRLTAKLYKDTYGNFPAHSAILNTLTEGSVVDFDTACRIQGRYFTQLVTSKAAKNMMKAFWYDLNIIKDGVSRPKGFGRFRPQKAGVVGAGAMGSGIAFVCAAAGIEVVLKDISTTVAELGKTHIANRIDELIAFKKLIDPDKKQILHRIHPTDTSRDFEYCDIIIETVFENQQLKSKVIRESEQFLDEYAIIASNTSAIPISALGAATARPANFVGMRFFFPVETAPLVEIIRGEHTSGETIARAFDFVRAIHKIPVIVKDHWGFFVARVQNTFILEGVALLQEGYGSALIEHLALQAGMRQSPLALADELGLGLVLEYERQAALLYGNKYISHPAVKGLNLLRDTLKRPGKPEKKGFYEITASGERRLWNELPVYFPDTRQAYDRREITERLLFAQVLEALWCLHEKVIPTIEEADIASILGWGFPRNKGGVIQCIADYGVYAFVLRCKDFETRLGPRFQLPKRLEKLLADIFPVMNKIGESS
jgi:3-hydroxyacyl-CoA dehydrogenase/enoyl-CoA hydratase/3-hydroxybutyryl-CoA epimerase